MTKFRISRLVSAKKYTKSQT